MSVSILNGLSYINIDLNSAGYTLTLFFFFGVCGCCSFFASTVLGRNLFQIKIDFWLITWKMAFCLPKVYSDSFTAISLPFPFFLYNPYFKINLQNRRLSLNYWKRKKSKIQECDYNLVESWKFMLPTHTHDKILLVYSLYRMLLYFSLSCHKNAFLLG